MTNFGFSLVTDFRDDSNKILEFCNDMHPKEINFKANRANKLAYEDEEDFENQLLMQKANKCIELVVESDNFDALSFLKEFTDESDFQFQKEIPSSFFTKLIDYIRNIETNEKYGLLAIQIIGNMWREYDAELDVLIDQDLVKAVFDVMLMGFDCDAEVASLDAVTNLVEHCFDALKEFLNEKTIQKMKDVFIMAMDSRDAEVLLEKIINLFTAIINSKQFNCDLFISIIYLVDECMERKINNKLFSSCLNFIAGLSENKECLKVIQSLNYIKKVVSFLKESDEIKKISSCYKILINIAPDKGLLIKDDIIEMLSNHIQKFKDVPVVGIYEYIQSLTEIYPDELYELGFYNFLFEFSSQLCFQNREYVSECFCGYLIYGKNYEKKLEFLLSGSLAFVCDIIPCLNNTFAIAKMLNYIIKIIQIFSSHAKEVLEQTCILSDLESIISEQEQANDDIIVMYNFIKDSLN